MKLEEFRDMVLDSSIEDNELKQIYGELRAESRQWDTICQNSNPLEYIANGDALVFIQRHRPELAKQILAEGVTHASGS